MEGGYYRHLERETNDGDTIEDLSFSGPMLGCSFVFKIRGNLYFRCKKWFQVLRINFIFSAGLPSSF